MRTGTTGTHLESMYVAMCTSTGITQQAPLFYNQRQMNAHVKRKPLHPVQLKRKAAGTYILYYPTYICYNGSFLLITTPVATT